MNGLDVQWELEVCRLMSGLVLRWVFPRRREPHYPSLGPGPGVRVEKIQLSYGVERLFYQLERKKYLPSSSLGAKRSFNFVEA